MKRVKITISDLYCKECGFHTTVPRSDNKKRSLGHLKQMWCPVCSKEVNFIEVRETDFKLEYVLERACL